VKRKNCRTSFFRKESSMIIKNGTFRAEKVDAVFRCITDVNRVSGDDKQKQDGMKTVLSSFVGMTRLPSAILRGVLKQSKPLPRWRAAGLLHFCAPASKLAVLRNTKVPA
jgi:hypothetical protein